MMHIARVAVLLVAGLVPFHCAKGKYVQYETREVPIARAFTNLQTRWLQNSNDFLLTYYLARLHSMAYSTNLVTVDMRIRDDLPQLSYPGESEVPASSVQKFATPEARELGLRHLTNAIGLYEQATALLKKSTNEYYRRWMVLPTQLGLTWCLDQAGRTNDAIAMYRKTLKVAWQREVTGDFDFKQWANDVWSDVRTGRNPLHSHSRGYLYGVGSCYSEETIRYLLRLLDPVKDASEIAQLKEDQKTLGTLGRSISPIFIPLMADARFNELVDENASVAFDLDGSGTKRNWAWLTPKAGWLVFDPEHAGHITSALQMFGSVTFWIFWPDGYEALSALDDNGDGVLSGSELHGLAVWNDLNCNGISDPGEVIPVEDLGIQAISCQSHLDANGLRWNPQGVTFTNGLSRATYDWIVPGKN